MHERAKEKVLIKCHLSRMMGERKLKVSEVCRDTGLHRNTVSALYYERATRIDLNAIDSLCNYFECNISDLFEHNPSEQD